MTPEYCFKIRMRTLLSEMSHTKNFIIDDDGNIILDEGSQQKILIIDSKNTALVKEIKADLLKKGIDLNKIMR
jgi:hypothetical protein